MPSCPSSTAGGCRCPEHHPGLGEYASEPVAYEAALAPLRDGVTLHIVTAGLTDEVQCDGTMTCSCQRCLEQRRLLQDIARDRPQPWDPRPARHSRAA